MLANAYLHTKATRLQGKIPLGGFDGSLCEFLSKPILELCHTLNVKESLGYLFLYAIWQKKTNFKIESLTL